MPVRHAPRLLAADYLALYQTGAFGAERWAVCYIAAVQQVRIALRRELLPEEDAHPRAGERYYCFQIGPLEALQVPVPSRRLRRITFIATTYGQLLCARDVAELWRRPEGNPPAGVWGAGLAGVRIITR